MAEQADRQRRVVHFQGIVQGVGFRYTTVRIASGFDVTGYVQNLPDGRVRVVAEGSPAVLDQFLGTVRKRMESYLDDVEQETYPATGEFTAFDIRF
jgi:acylphosphatase